MPGTGDPVPGGKERGSRQAQQQIGCSAYHARAEDDGDGAGAELAQSAMVLSRGKIAFRVNRETSEKGRSEPGLCGGHSE